MNLANVYQKLDVLKSTILLVALTFTFSSAHAESPEAQEAKRVDQIVAALKRQKRCESVVLSSDNLSTVLWLHKGELKSSQPLWSSDSRRKLSRLIKNLKLNHKIVDTTLPTQLQFEVDPYKTSQLVSKGAVDSINEFKWKGQLDCKAKVGSKAKLIFDLLQSFEPRAEAQGELGSGHRLIQPPATHTDMPNDEKATAQNLVTALKKKNAKGSCHSFLVEAKNLTAVMWIENAQLVSGGYLWDQEARQLFRAGIKGVDVVKRDLKRRVPSAKSYAKDPIRSAQVFEKEFDNAFREAKQKQQFRCGLSAIN